MSKHVSKGKIRSEERRRFADKPKREAAKREARRAAKERGE